MYHPCPLSDIINNKDYINFKFQHTQGIQKVLGRLESLVASNEPLLYYDMQ